MKKELRRMNMKSYNHKSGTNEYIANYGDCKDMSKIKDGQIQLIFTSPPYYNLKDYSTKPKKQENQTPHSPKEHNQTYEEYLSEMLQVWKECTRVLSDDGVLIINIDVIKFKAKNGNIIPIPFDFISQCSKIGLGCKDIWIYKINKMRAFTVFIIPVFFVHESYGLYFKEDVLVGIERHYLNQVVQQSPALGVFGREEKSDSK